jgi:hypothetical protein
MYHRAAGGFCRFWEVAWKHGLTLVRFQEFLLSIVLVSNRNKILPCDGGFLPLVLDVQSSTWTRVVHES